MTENELRMHQDAKPDLFTNTRRLRENSTKSEILLWEKLKNKQLGFKFRRQHPLGVFILDFYCHEAKLCIEVDGEYHNQSQQIQYDQERTNQIISSGLIVIRFSNSQIENNVEQVVIEIKQIIDNLLKKKDLIN